MQINDFTKNILNSSAEISSIGHITGSKGGQIPVFKGTLEQTDDSSRFTYLKVDDLFITKLAETAKNKLDAGFKPAPYLSNGHDGKVGAHITLNEGHLPSKLAAEDQGKEVYFRLKPIIWDWQHKGNLLNGRVLAVAVELLGGDGMAAIEKNGFSTFSPHHITFAQKNK